MGCILCFPCPQAEKAQMSLCSPFQGHVFTWSYVSYKICQGMYQYFNCKSKFSPPPHFPLRNAASEWPRAFWERTWRKLNWEYISLELSGIYFCNSQSLLCACPHTVVVASRNTPPTPWADSLGEVTRGARPEVASHIEPETSLWKILPIMKTKI